MPSFSYFWDLAQHKRTRLFNQQGHKTNAWRCFDGIGDGLEGVIIEQFADHFLISTQHQHLPDGFENWLQHQSSSWYWKRLDQHDKTAPTWLHGKTIELPFLILEHGLKYEISFDSGYSQGIFLDQRLNREFLMQRAQSGMKVLNTFAYTGAFSIAAASQGAETTTLDLSQTYLQWAKRNFEHNQLHLENHHFCKGDAFQWMQRFAKQGRKFDIIILDPPTFSRDQKGTIFRVTEHFRDLLKLAYSLLPQAGIVLCSTNCHQLTWYGFEQQIRSVFPKMQTWEKTPMPSDFTGEPYLKSVWIQK